MTKESRLLIDVLRRSVIGTTEELDLDVDWQQFLCLAQMHMLLPLMCDGLRKVYKDWAQVPENVKQQLHQAFLQAIYQDAHIETIAETLKKKLEQEKISHIFLKGIVLKQNYPIPALRVMCDVDILVYMKDYPQIDQVMQKLGGTLIDGDSNHRNYSFPRGVIIEFHPNLLHNETPVGTGINPGWQYAAPSNPTKLTEEGFYLNTICHLANHFAAGGAGVRFVLDVWVNRYLRKPEADREIVERELERIGLKEFAKNIELLADCWFGSGESTPLLDELGEYILHSGLHGHTKLAILNAMSLSTGGTQLSMLIGKIFNSRRELEDRFHWCKGKSWLLPFAWFARIYKAMTTHGDLILKWTKGTMSVTREEIIQQKLKLDRFGIRRNEK